MNPAAETFPIEMGITWRERELSLGHALMASQRADRKRLVPLQHCRGEPIRRPARSPQELKLIKAVKKAIKKLRRHDAGPQLPDPKPFTLP
jgi:hypothetical protein